jgi:type I restriction enzyme R subunit
VLRAEPGFERLRDQVKEIAGLLEEKASIPTLKRELPLVLDVQTNVWWEDVTAAMRETVRQRLRSLVRLIEKRRRKPIYTDFDDDMGGEAVVELPEFKAPGSYARFRAKARRFLKAHEDHVTIRKLRMNHLPSRLLIWTRCGGGR